MTEIEKLDNCKKERNLIKGFLRFASEKCGFDLKSDKTMFVGTIGYCKQIEDMINSYFNIDPDKLFTEISEQSNGND